MFQALYFSKIYGKNLCKNPFNIFFFIFYNFTKMKFKSLSALSLSEIVKKNNKTLGPACYIEDCQISDAWTWTWHYSTLFTFRILHEFVMSVHLLCTLLTYPYCLKHVHAGCLILDCTFWEISKKGNLLAKTKFKVSSFFLLSLQLSNSKIPTKNDMPS